MIHEQERAGTGLAAYGMVYHTIVRYLSLVDFVELVLIGMLFWVYDT